MHIVAEALGIGPEPQSERGRHSHLEMGVSGDETVLVHLAAAQQQVEELLHPGDGLFYPVPCEELEVHHYLVVSGAARVYLLAFVPELAGEHQLDLRVHVLDAVLNHEAAFARLLEQGFELGQQRIQVLLREESAGVEHGNVGHRPDNVIFSEIQVHLAVVSDGEAVNLRIHLEALVPEL